MMKRPSACKRPSASHAPEKRPRVAIPWHYVVKGSEHPDWAQHFVDTLHAPFLNLKQKLGADPRITMWSDCAGKCTEKYAGDLLAVELMKKLDMDVRFELYGASDAAAHCKEFVKRNCEPTHFNDNVFQRDFDADRFDCSMCRKKCVLPTAGIDIYWCCFPCGPWSKRGKRLGLNDRNAGVCWQTIKTIKHMVPVMFVMENVVEIGSSSDGVDDLTTIKSFMDDQLGDKYNSITINGISPIHHGYPTEKKRVIVVGARTDQVDAATLSRVFTKLIEVPMPVVDTYWTFLNCQDTRSAFFDKVGTLPEPQAAMKIQRSGCTCRIDPMTDCLRHPCFCKKCKDGKVLECSWRAKAVKYLADNTLTWAAADGCITYIQALELINEYAPHSARERNLLNVLARLPAAQPLRETMMILDISQAIDRSRPKFDGTVPTMATNAKMWSMQAGRLLDVSEMAKLMEHDLGKADLRFTSAAQMSTMLGMSMHVGTAGFALSGLLAAVGGYDLHEGLISE